MATKISASSVFEHLEIIHAEIRSQEAGLQNQYHLSKDVLIDRIKRTVFKGAQALETFYKGHCAERFQELAHFSSVLTAAQQKYSAMTAEQRKDPSAIRQKDQCLKNYWTLMDSFEKARVVAAQLGDAEQFLAASSRNNPSEKGGSWEALMAAAEGFCPLAEKVDEQSTNKRDAILAGKTEFIEVGAKVLQAFEERHGPATVEFLRLFLESGCTKVPREGVVDPQEETVNAGALLGKREALCLDVFKRTRALHEQEAPRILKVASVLANFREAAIVFNTQLKNGRIDITNAQALDQRVTLYQDFAGYLKEEVCKIGALAAQLKLIGKFLASTQPLDDVGTRFVAQAQFTEFKAVKEEKERVSQQNADQVYKWAEATENAYLNVMKELEGWNGEATELKHVLDRFLSYKQNNWKPLGVFSTAWAGIGRVLSSSVAVGSAVYEKEFWNRNAAVAPATRSASPDAAID